MQISFTFDNLAEAARVLELLNDGESTPTGSGANASRNSGRAGGSASANADSDDRPPWEADEPRSAQKASKAADTDPWADSASTGSSSSAASSGRSSGRTASTVAGEDFPASGAYERQAKSGFQVWTFGLDSAPECDCGHKAAQVEGYKGKDSARGKPWTAYWCPVGFGKNWKKKCEFSEFA